MAAAEFSTLPPNARPISDIPVSGDTKTAYPFLISSPASGEIPVSGVVADEGVRVRACKRSFSSSCEAAETRPSRNPLGAAAAS